jgi:hypothetical protein
MLVGRLVGWVVGWFVGWHFSVCVESKSIPLIVLDWIQVDH